MMPQLYSVSDNSFYTRGFPWIERIVAGLNQLPVCPECKGTRTGPTGDIEGILQSDKGTTWPDAIGCGHYPLFIVSSRVISDWRSERIADYVVGGKVTLKRPLPKLLRNSEPPAYFWLNGEKMLGARMDFDASGFVGVRVCSACARRMDNIEATYDRQHDCVWPYAFVEGSWTGAKLFTTDLSSTQFFCCEEVVRLAGSRRHTNFRFIRVEEGIAASSKGMRYM